MSSLEHGWLGIDRNHRPYKRSKCDSKPARSATEIEKAVSVSKVQVLLYNPNKRGRIVRAAGHIVWHGRSEAGGTRKRQFGCHVYCQVSLSAFASLVPSEGFGECRCHQKQNEGRSDRQRCDIKSANRPLAASAPGQTLSHYRVGGESCFIAQTSLSGIRNS